MTNKDAQDIGDVVLHLIDGLSVVTVGFSYDGSVANTINFVNQLAFY